MRHSALLLWLGLAVCIAAPATLGKEIGAKEDDKIEVEARGKTDDAIVKGARQTSLKIEISPLIGQWGTAQGHTGEPLDTVIIVTNTSTDRLYNPALGIALFGDAPRRGCRVLRHRERADPDPAPFTVSGR